MLLGCPKKKKGKLGTNLGCIKSELFFGGGRLVPKPNKEVIEAVQDHNVVVVEVVLRELDDLLHDHDS